MTNSLDERTIRPFTIGRKNWILSGSPRGAEASAAIYSMVETAKANNLDPKDYLRLILHQMPNEQRPYTKETLDKYLPWSRYVSEQFE